MRAPVSVVIPTLNAEAALGACLACLYEGVQAGLIRELIVVDGGSNDGTVHLAREAGATVIETTPSRGHQLQIGCAQAQGDWLLVLHADSLLDEEWSVAIQAHLHSSNAGYFKLKFEGGGVMASIVAGWANLRARLFGLPFGDQGMLISRHLYDEVGGYPDFELMEDVVLVRALAGRLVRLDIGIVTSSQKYRQQGWFRRGARNIVLQLRYFTGASPDKLAQAYRKS